MYDGRHAAATPRRILNEDGEKPEMGDVPSGAARGRR